MAIWGNARTEHGTDQGVTELFGQLTRDARGLLSAEMALQKARLLNRVTIYKSAAISLGIAAILGLATLIAALGGLILTLAPHVGPGFATLIVVAVMGIIIAVLVMNGLGKLRAPTTGDIA